MGYKPFLTNASLTDVQALLRGLEFPTMDGFPILAIDGEGFTFEDGVATLKEIPPDITEILAHLADNDIHGDHAALNAILATLLPPGKTFGIKAKNANKAATGITTITSAPLYHRNLSMGIFVPKSLLTEECIFYRIKNDLGANVFEFGKDADYNLYAKIGNSAKLLSSYVDHGPDSYLPFDMDADESLHEVGCWMTDTDIKFFYYGFGETQQAIGTWEYPSGSTSFTTDLLVNCPGVQLSYLRMLKGQRYPTGVNYTPLGKGFFPSTWAYYDFMETSGNTLLGLGEYGYPLSLTADGERVSV